MSKDPQKVGRIPEAAPGLAVHPDDPAPRFEVDPTSAAQRRLVKSGVPVRVLMEIAKAHPGKADDDI